MSKDWIFEILVKLGFTEKEAKVYIFLLTKKPKKASDIARKLKIQKKKKQLDHILKNLGKKGVLDSSSEISTQVSAVNLERVFEILKKANIEQYKELEDNKEMLLLNWKTLTHQE